MLSTSLGLFITCKSSSVVGPKSTSCQIEFGFENYASAILSFDVPFSFPYAVRTIFAVFTFSDKSRTPMFHMFGLPRHFNFYIQSDCHFIEASKVSNRK